MIFNVNYNLSEKPPEQPGIVFNDFCEMTCHLQLSSMSSVSSELIKVLIFQDQLK